MDVPSSRRAAGHRCANHVRNIEAAHFIPALHGPLILPLVFPMHGA